MAVCDESLSMVMALARENTTLSVTPGPGEKVRCLLHMQIRY